MRNEVDALGLSRRNWLVASGAFLLAGGRLWAGEFWDKKDPADWSGEEIDRLTTKSPWAKPVTAKYAPGEAGEERPQQRRGGAVGPGTIGIGRIGFPRGRGSNGGGYPRGGAGRGGGESPFKGTVRWESALPIREAMKTDLPEGFAELYVISVRDIPLREPRSRERERDDDSSDGLSKNAQMTLMQATTLQLKGGDMIEPIKVKQMTPGGTYFLFGFRKSEFDFDKKERELDFTTRLGSLIVKTKFDLGEMKYHGKLAV